MVQQHLKLSSIAKADNQLKKINVEDRGRKAKLSHLKFMYLGGDESSEVQFNFAMSSYNINLL